MSSYAEPNDQITGSAAYGDTAAVPVPVLVPVAVPTTSSSSSPFGEPVGSQATSTRGDIKSGVNSTASSAQHGIDSAAQSANKATDVAADKANQAAGYAADKTNQVKGSVNNAANTVADKANTASNIASEKASAASASISQTAQTANEKAARAAQLAKEQAQAVGQQAQQGLQQVGGKVVDLTRQAANHPAVQNATVEVGKQIDGLDRELSKYPLLNDLSAQTHIPKPYLLLAVALPITLIITFNIFGLASPLTNAIGWGVPAWLTVRNLEKESGGQGQGQGYETGQSAVPGGYRPGQGYNGPTAQGQGITGSVASATGSTSGSTGARGNDDKQWLTYWVVFGYLNLLESFALRPLLYYVPYYFVFKLAGIAWLASSSTRGAEKVFYTVVRPTYRHLSARARAAQNSGSYGLKPTGTSAPSANAAQTAQSGYNTVTNNLNNASANLNNNNNTFGTDSYNGASGYSSSNAFNGATTDDATGLTHRSIGERTNNPFVGGQSGVAVVEEIGVVGGPRIVY